MRIAILISGRGSNMAALMANQDSFDICLVASDRPAVGLETAAAAGHETVLVDRNMYRSRQEHESEMANKLVCQKPDMIVLAGYMSVLSSTFIERFDGHIINIHPSLLPDYRGLNTHSRVLADNCREHGVSVHLVTAAVDEGPLIAQAKLAVRAYDTEQTLSNRVLKCEHQIYPAVISSLGEGTLKIQAQSVVWANTARLESVTHGIITFPQT
jgi:phosphoribosylglycinamide formyltransferase-1